MSHEIESLIFRKIISFLLSFVISLIIYSISPFILYPKGIFQRAEKDKLIVATTTGEHVSCSSYASAKIIFEQDRQIKITNDLHSWIEQDGDDPAAAHAGAPLGFTGIVESVRKMNEKGGRGNAFAASEEREDNPESDPECGLQHRQVKKIPSVEQHPDYCKDADLAFLPTTDFTFLLDLTDTIGIDVAQRRHRGVVVTRVEEESAGQAR